MIYRNLGIRDLLDSARDKSIICFGAGQELKNACDTFSDYSLFDNIELIADNDLSKKTFIYNCKEKPVYSIDKCIKNVEKKPIILITVLDCLDIIEQLEKISELNECECYIYRFMLNHVEPYELAINRAKTEIMKIPKIIHYCWFGGNPIADDFLDCIESWKKHCPEYEIVRWDESNYDYKKNAYMYEAYLHRKWGFVSDFARLDIVSKYGGIYLDTDVEIIRNFDDLLYDEAFCAFENRNIVANGLGFGAISGFGFIKANMQIYDNMSFINQDGTLNLTTGPRYQTDLFIANGLKLNNSKQSIQGMTVYPSDVLCPYSPLTGLNITKNTYSIHHYSATWYDYNQRILRTKMVERYINIRDLFKTQG